MKQKATFKGIISNSRVQAYEVKRLQNFCAGLEGEEVQVTIEKFRRIRSDEQNRYYWGVVIKIACRETGWTKSEMHDYLKYTLLTETLVLEKEGKMYEVKSYDTTTNKKTTEFENYLRSCREHLSVEFGIYIPLPHEEEGGGFSFNL
jgi:hypothetical protein